MKKFKTWYFLLSYTTLWTVHIFLLSYTTYELLIIWRRHLSQPNWPLPTHFNCWVRCFWNCQKGCSLTHRRACCCQDNSQVKDTWGGRCWKSIKGDAHSKNSKAPKYNSTLWSNSIANQIIETKRYLFLVTEFI